MNPIPSMIANWFAYMAKNPMVNISREGKMICLKGDHRFSYSYACASELSAAMLHSFILQLRSRMTEEELKDRTPASIRQIIARIANEMEQEQTP